jgi:hypothetical protein
MLVRVVTGVFATCLMTSGLTAQSYRVVPLKESAPKQGLAPAIAETLAPSGYRVLQGDKVVCDVWLRSQWELKPGFQPSFNVLYPFEVGELIGVVRFPTPGSDFRKQQLAAGLYTLRYAQQPQDGNHVGTSDTLDFLLLVQAADDTSPKTIDPMALIEKSAKAAKSTHPAMFALRPMGAEVDSLPALIHDEERELWSLRVQGRGKSGEETRAQAIEFVVVGHAPE